MAHETRPPQAEVDSTPEVHFFNVAAMSDEEIIVLYRGLEAANGSGDHESRAQAEIADDLVQQMVHGIGELANREPERVRQLVARCARSEIDDDRILAASVSRSLLDYDYEFTRDTLIFIATDDDRPRDAPGRSGDLAGDVGAGVISDLMVHRLTPEQIKDWEAREAAAKHREG